MLSLRFSLVILFATALLATGCRRREISNYRIPKETEPSRSAAATPATSAADTAMANTAVETATGDSLTWTGAAHWTAKPATAMRRGSFAIAGADNTTAELTITAFPGDVGGELANLNRWRGQLQLPPISADELAGSIERFEHNSLSFAVVDLVAPPGADPKRILGASVPFAGSTWFFKLMGPPALVENEKAAFRALLDSVKPSVP